MIPEEIRFSEMEDLSYLEQWLSGDEACDGFPFGPEEKADALKNWIGFSRFKASLTGVHEGVPCAVGTLFLMPYKKVSHHCSFYLAVDPTQRNKGIGTSMIKNLLNLAKTRFRLESVHVELYEPSPLLSVVKKLGFETIAKQDDFVKMNGTFRPRILLEHFLK